MLVQTVAFSGALHLFIVADGIESLVLVFMLTPVRFGMMMVMMMVMLAMTVAMTMALAWMEKGGKV